MGQPGGKAGRGWVPDGPAQARPKWPYTQARAGLREQEQSVAAFAACVAGARARARAERRWRDAARVRAVARWHAGETVRCARSKRRGGERRGRLTLE